MAQLGSSKVFGDLSITGEFYTPYISNDKLINHTIKKSVKCATTADLGASLQTLTTLTGYSRNPTIACTTTAGSTTITTSSTAGIKAGAVVSTATTALASGTAIASVTNSTTFVVTNRTNITTTAITGDGATATATFAAQTYSPYAVGSTIVISGATPATYNGSFVVTACTTASVSWSSTETVTATVQGTISFTIAAGTSLSTAFAQTIAALVVDGITLAINERVLVKNQTTVGGFSTTANRDNGIYYLSTLGSTSTAWVLTRAVDADTTAKIASSMVSIEAGSTFGGFLFDNDLKATDTLGTTAMIWYRIIDEGSALTSGSTLSGYLKYNGTTSTAGQLDGSTTNPTGTTRLNYNGYFYATRLYGDGSQITNISIPTGLTAGSTSTGFINYNGTTSTAGQWDGNTTNPSATTRLNYGGYLYATKLYSGASEVYTRTSFASGGSTFNSTTGVVIAHSMGAPSAYSVLVTPTSNGAGYIGEWYVVKGTNTMTVYCTGSTTTTTFDYFIKLV